MQCIIWSRSLYTNIQRSILFRLTVSVSALAICVVEVVVYDAFPLNAVQVQKCYHFVTSSSCNPAFPRLETFSLTFYFFLMQLLLLNLIIDILGALALAYRPRADHRLMGKPPVGIRYKI